MDDIDRPAWRMTNCEAQLLRDIASLAATLKVPWVPKALIVTVGDARGMTQARQMLRTLVAQGYMRLDAASQQYSRTGKQVPVMKLVGATPDPLPTGTIQRLVKLWRKGQREFTLEDCKPATNESHELPVHSPRHRRA